MIGRDNNSSRDDTLRPLGDPDGQRSRTGSRVNPRWSGLGNLTLALIAVGVAWAARYALNPVIGDQYAFITFFPAVMFAAWVGGMWTALLAAMLSTVIAAYSFVPPANSLWITTTDHQVALGLFAFFSVAIGLFGQAQKRATLRARASERLATARGVDLEREGATRRVAEDKVQLQNEELQASVEELEVIQEELRTHNEELSHSRMALELSQQRYIDLFEFAPDAYIVTDVKGVIREANRAAAAMLNVLPGALVGEPLDRLIEGSSRTTVQPIIEAVLANQDVKEFELRVKPVAKPALDVAATVGLIRGETDGSLSGGVRGSGGGAPGGASGGASGGGATGLRWLIRDITARKELQERINQWQQRASTILESVTDCALALDQDWRITFMNRHAEAACQRAAAAVTGKVLWDEFPELRGTEIERLYRRAASRKAAVHFTVKSPWANRWFEMHAYPSAEGLTVFFQDVTVRMQAQDVLIKHKEILEQTVEARTSELEAAHQSLRSTERLATVGTLAAGLGHDMGNLLLPLQMRLDAMEALPGAAAAEAADHMQAIRQCIQYLQRLSNGLRLFAMDPLVAPAAGERTSISDWWCEIETFMRNAIPRGSEMLVSIAENLPPARVSRQGLTQAVFNLVQNAGDALRNRAHGDGSVTISANLDEATDMVQIGVADNGPGMSPEVKARCLEPFYTTKTRGMSTGLGLSIVRGIMERSGGSLRIESEPGRGATFMLSFPADRRAAAPTPAVRPVAAISLADSRIEAYSRVILESMGFEIHHAEFPETESAPREPLLWVTGPLDGGAAGAKRLAEFVRKPNRRVVVFDSASSGAAHGSSGSNGGGGGKEAGTEAAAGAGTGVGGLDGNPRIIRLDHSARPAAIRAALREAAEAVTAAG